MNQTHTHDSSASYSEAGLWNKLKNVTRKVGATTLHQVFCLWLVIRDGAAPLWAKGVATSALGYLISPLDAIPDIAPVIGLSDDAAVIAAAFATLAAYVTDDIRARARAMLPEWMQA